jgi:hypothetical protein
MTDIREAPRTPPTTTATPTAGTDSTNSTKDPEGGGGAGGLIALLGMMGAGVLFLGLEGKVKAVPPKLVNGQLVRQPLQIEPLVRGGGKAGRAGTMIALGGTAAVAGAGLLYGSAKTLGDKDNGVMGKVAGVTGLGLGVGALASAAYFVTKIR